MEKTTFSHALKTKSVNIDFTGSKCSSCNRVFFPKKRVCPNCLSVDGMNEVRMPREGKVFSLAVHHTGSTEDFLIPYISGYIELTNGIRLFALMENGETEIKPEIGMKVSLAEIRKNEKNQLLYVFKPSTIKETIKL